MCVPHRVIYLLYENRARWRSLVAERINISWIFNASDVNANFYSGIERYEFKFIIHGGVIEFYYASYNQL